MTEEKSLEQQVKVSVIIPTYNRALLLPRAVSSVLNQTFTDWELLIVDDGSSDGTSEFLHELEKVPRVRVLRSQNFGVSSARNWGIRESRGSWVCFLDSDDEWLSHKLERQMQYAQSHADRPLIHGNEIWIRNGVRVNPMKKHQKKGGDVFVDALKLCCISPSTVMIKRSLFDQVGFFREDFPVCEDYELWLRITARFKIGFVEDPIIIKYGGHEDQLSRKFKAMDYWRVEAIHQLIRGGELDAGLLREASAELEHKCKVLLKGYRKHQNFGSYDQIFSIYTGSKVEPSKKFS